MSEHKRIIVHHHKLETSTKLILAAIAVALAIQAFGPWLSPPRTVQADMDEYDVQKIIESCKVRGYVEFIGNEGYLYSSKIRC